MTEILANRSIVRPPDFTTPDQMRRTEEYRSALVEVADRLLSESKTATVQIDIPLPFGSDRILIGKVRGIVKIARRRVDEANDRTSSYSLREGNPTVIRFDTKSNRQGMEVKPANHFGLSILYADITQYAPKSF